MIYSIPAFSPSETPTQFQYYKAYRLQDIQGDEPMERFLQALMKRDEGPKDEVSALSKTLYRIEALREMKENWNGYEVAVPDAAAIEHACNWLNSFYHEIIDRMQEWIAPHVTADEEGSVVFEWVRGRKWLSVYVSQTTACYIQAWGPDVLDEMRDGEATTTWDRQAIWTWLLER